MAHVYKNAYALDVGTTFVELYACSGDEGFFSIITGMTISNKKLNEVLVDVRIVDSTNLVTAYLITDSKLSVGASLALAGDIQNIVLKEGDSIEVACNETTALDVSMSIMENDPSISYGGAFDGIWYGNIAFTTEGESNGQYISEYTFSTGASVTNIGTWSTLYTSIIGASDGNHMYLMGGYSSFARTDIRTHEFATRTQNYSWGDLYEGFRISDSASNGIQALIMGGYNASAPSTSIHKVILEENTISSNFGDMSWGSQYYQGAMGNSVYALALGYTGGSTNIQYVEHATESNSALWGYMVYSAYGVAGASNEERGIHSRGFTNSNYIQLQEFASQGNSVFFANLASSNYEMGASSDGLVVYFMGGEYPSNGAYTMDLYSGASSTANGTYYFDGGVPCSESGGGAA